MTRVAAGISLQIILMLRFGLPEVACVENRRPIARADVVALTIARRRVVNLEEELEDLAIADTRRIEDDLDSFGMSAMIFIRGVGRAAARVADARRQDAVFLTNKV